MTTRNEVFEKINKTKKLPSPSGTSLRVIQLCHDETSSLKDIAEVIQVDPALSAELLKYANSFFLASGIQVASVHKAAVRLGIRTVVNLALGLSLLHNNKKGKCPRFNYDKFWSVSLLQAIAARSFASAGQEFDPEEIFVCALLSNMGQLALASVFPQEYGELLHKFGFQSCGEWGRGDADQPSNHERRALEKEQFQIDSSALTVELFLSWGLPAHFAVAAGFYDDLSSTELISGDTQKIAELLNLAHQLAELCQHVPVLKTQLSALEKTAQKFDIAAEHFAVVFDAIIDQWHEWGEMIEIKTCRCGRYDDIMGEENETG